jgi:hypothetical protein
MQVEKVHGLGERIRRYELPNVFLMPVTSGLINVDDTPCKRKCQVKLFVLHPSTHPLFDYSHPSLDLSLPSPSIAQARPPRHDEHPQRNYQDASQICYHSLLTNLLEHLTSDWDANEGSIPDIGISR